MTSTYIVGYDGSPGSRAAIDLAVRLAAPTNGRVLAVTSSARATHPPAEPPAPVPGVEHVSEPGRPVAALCNVAERVHADMIIVGATRRGIVGRLAPGSLAEHLVQGAPCAIAVAPSETPDRPIRAVAVAYDGSAESVAALTAAQLLASAQGAALRILAVCETPWSSIDLPLVEIQDPARDRLEADVKRIVAELPPSLRPSGEVLTGRAGHALVLACPGVVDLLVAGSRSYGPLHGALVGSVSRHLVDHALCPVVIVPRGAASSHSPATPYGAAASSGGAGR